MKYPYLKRTAAALLAALVLAGCPAAVFAGEPEAPASQSESASVAPAVLMSRGEMAGPLAAGQEEGCESQQPECLAETVQSVN